ncbi:MAG TPA: ATP synthase F0 subunit B [Terracidiphilus sp.]
MRYSTLHARFSARVFRFAVMAAFAAGVTVAPFKLAAQEAAPAVKTEPAGQASATQAKAQDAAKPEAGQSREEQDNAFLLNGPLVKASAKVLHLPIETTAGIFEFINFAILALAIGIPLFRWLPKTIRKRAVKVRADIESARKLTEDANSRLSAVEAKLEKIDEEIAKFRTEVERESLADEARINAALEEESARIVLAAEQEISVAAAQARRGLRNFAADLAIEQAAKQMILTPETDRALIAEFVGDAGKGGKN